MTIRILIADDHGVLRAGLRSLLNAEPDMEVIGEAESSKEAVSLANHSDPDVILMDISMPGEDGLEGTRQILASQPKRRVLLLTVHEDSSLMREALQIGATGYILKRAVESELIDAIRAVARGELYIHPAMTRALLDEPTGSRPVQSNQVTITQREVEILRYIAQGYTNRQIAELLCISVRTVESHRANLMDKLDLHSRVELVRYATDHGLLDKGDFQR